MVQSLRRGFRGRWSSAFDAMNLCYNDRMWSPVEEHHSPDDTLFGLIDKSDGSTFLIRVETVEEGVELESSAIAAGLASPLVERGMLRGELGRTSLLVNSVEFDAYSYLIDNPKFGRQMLQQAFCVVGGVYVVLQFGWPSRGKTPCAEVPVKLRILLDGLSVAAEG